MDDWIETDLGSINGRLEVLPVKLNIENIGKLPEVMEELRLYREFLKQNLPAAVEPTDTHLLNIRDEMLAAVDRCLYRLSQD